MDEQGTKSGFNQGLMFALIGAVATILAALIPVFANRDQPSQVPTSTAIVQVTEAPTFTPLPPTETATVTPTSTLEPPTPTRTPTMGFYDVYLAVDRDGEVPSVTFSSSQPVYAVFKINDPTDIGRVEAVWYAVDVPGIDANSIVYRAEYTILKSKGTVAGGGNGAWKAGKYKLELYLNGQLSSTQEFQVTR